MALKIFYKLHIILKVQPRPLLRSNIPQTAVVVTFYFKRYIDDGDCMNHCPVICLEDEKQCLGDLKEDGCLCPPTCHTKFQDECEFYCPKQCGDGREECPGPTMSMLSAFAKRLC
jgi:hypothetical protein